MAAVQATEERAPKKKVAEIFVEMAALKEAEMVLESEMERWNLPRSADEDLPGSNPTRGERGIPARRRIPATIWIPTPPIDAPPPIHTPGLERLPRRGGG